MYASYSNRTVKVVFKGVLKGLAKRDELKIHIDEPISLGNLIKTICKLLGEDFSKRVVDEDGEISSDILVEYNNKIAVAKNNTELLIKEGDELVVFSFVHGG